MKRRIDLKIDLKRYRPKLRTVLIVAASAWIVLVAAGTIPAWNRTRQNAEQLAQTTARQAGMAEWLVAGEWLEGGVQEWEPKLAGEYDRLFPDRRERETLYLELARVARESRIAPLGVREEVDPDEDWVANDFDDNEGDDWGEESYDETSVVANQFAVELGELPGVELQSHRLVVEFQADYDRLTRFLAGLREIPRALRVHCVEASPGRDGVAVRMELDFYVQHAD